MVTIMGTLATAGIAIWLVWDLWGQLRSGRATIPWAFRWPTIERGGHPVRFWVTITGQALGVLVIIFFAFVLTLATVNPHSN